MPKNRKNNKTMCKGGYRKNRNKQTTSRSGLPKMYPSHCNPHLIAQKVG